MRGIARCCGSGLFVSGKDSARAGHDEAAAGSRMTRRSFLQGAAVAGGLLVIPGFSACGGNAGVEGQAPYKLMFLADLVELTGVVDAAGFGPSTAWNVVLDDNFAHLTGAVRGAGQRIHVEAYPSGICWIVNKEVQINRFGAWAIAEENEKNPTDPLWGKLWDASASSPAFRSIHPGDHVRIRGILLIENGHAIYDSDLGRAVSPETTHPDGGDGYVFLECHPHDYRYVRTVPADDPVARDTLIVVAPLYEYLKDDRTYFEVDSSGNVTRFASSVSGRIRVTPLSDEPAGAHVYYRESPIYVPVGSSPPSVTVTASGIEVHGTVNAPRTETYGGVTVADINDPASNSLNAPSTNVAVLMVEYHVAFQPLTGGLLRHAIRNADGTWQRVDNVNDHISDPGWVVAAGGASRGDGILYVVATDTGRLWLLLRDPTGSWTLSQTGYGSSYGPGTGGIMYPGQVEYISTVAVQYGSENLKLEETRTPQVLGIRPPAPNPATPAPRSQDFWGEIPSEPPPPPPHSPPTPPPTGTLHYLMATADGHVWHIVNVPDISWSPMVDLVSAAALGPDATRATAVAGILGANYGEIHVVLVRDGEHAVWYTFRSSNGTWSPIINVIDEIAGMPTPRGALAGTEAADNTGHFLFVDTSGQPWYASRDRAGSWSLAEDVGRKADSLQWPITSLAAVSVAPGEVQFAAVLSNGHVWRTVRRPSGQWDPWTELNSEVGGPEEPVLSVSATPGASGQSEFLFVTRQAGVADDVPPEPVPSTPSRPRSAR